MHMRDNKNSKKRSTAHKKATTISSAIGWKRHNCKQIKALWENSSVEESSREKRRMSAPQKMPATSDRKLSTTFTYEKSRAVHYTTNTQRCILSLSSERSDETEAERKHFVDASGAPNRYLVSIRNENFSPSSQPRCWSNFI